MYDPTEQSRREMLAAEGQHVRERLESEHGQVWSTSELTADFSVASFLAPFVMVCRKSDGVEGTLKFQHSPRFYYGFEVAK